MQVGWESLLRLRFTPSEAEGLTGVSTSLQRKWIQLHFSSMLRSDWQWDVSSGGHRRFTWGGIQLLVFFGDVIRDLGATLGAQKFAHMKHNADREYSDVLPQSHVFENDFRKYERGDLFLWRSLTESALPSFQTVLASAVPKILANEMGSRLYLYNLSAMQRDLVAKHIKAHQTPDFPDAILKSDQ